MKDISIINLFNEKELTEKNDGSYKTECPSCGLQGGRTKGFILFPKTNTAYCHSTLRWFSLLETYALKQGIIKCIDGVKIMIGGNGPLFG